MIGYNKEHFWTVHIHYLLNDQNSFCISIYSNVMMDALKAHSVNHAHIVTVDSLKMVSVFMGRHIA